MSVRYTPRAFRELALIYRHLLKESPQGATAVMVRIHSLLNTLAIQPRMGVRVSARRLRRASAQPYPYLVFYRVSKTGIVVHGFRHAARDPKTMPGV